VSYCISANDLLYFRRPRMKKVSANEREHRGSRKALQKPTSSSNEVVAMPESPPILTPLRRSVVNTDSLRTGEYDTPIIDAVYPSHCNLTVYNDLFAALECLDMSNSPTELIRF
jgi:hypothetical protein